MNTKLGGTSKKTIRNEISLIPHFKLFLLDCNDIEWRTSCDYLIISYVSSTIQDLKKVSDCAHIHKITNLDERFIAHWLLFQCLRNLEFHLSLNFVSAKSRVGNNKQTNCLANLIETLLRFLLKLYLCEITGAFFSLRLILYRYTLNCQP